MLREAVLRDADWEATAQAQREGAFGKHAAGQADVRRKRLLSSLDAFWAMDTGQDNMQVGAHGGSPAV